MFLALSPIDGDGQEHEVLQATIEDLIGRADPIAVPPEALGGSGVTLRLEATNRGDREVWIIDTLYAEVTSLADAEQAVEDATAATE